MKDCIFCRIVSSEADATIVYENEDYISFKTLEPVAEGHILVVPKEHAKTLVEMNEQSISGLGNALKESAQIAVEENNATGFNVLQANGQDAQQSVFHVHFHVVPRYQEDGLDLWIKQGL